MIYVQKADKEKKKEKDLPNSMNLNHLSKSDPGYGLPRTVLTPEQVV